MERHQQELQRAFGRVIARRRREAGLSQQEMWERLGMSKSSYRRREQEGRDWTLANQIAVAAILDAPLSELQAEAEKEAATVTTREKEDPGGDSWMSALGG
ncbi:MULTISPECIES: helix-turn-helix domain-containing protein [Nocardia]|uniref:helix-turn-helix domain-containing protein n=1 Tax=Nocardia TaxID=1817 RepID=UPI000D697E75|nr:MULTISPECIES: helix-turn-helix transcriptional regulator [Nocardia]